MLIRTIYNGVVDLYILQRPADRSPVHEKLQLILAGEPGYFPTGIVKIIPEVRYKTVRIINDRTLSVPLLQTIRIKLRLLLTYIGVRTCPFRFHNGKGLPVLTE
ncbi:hypothetical protein D3C74_348530 [compost metagenome]